MGQRFHTTCCPKPRIGSHVCNHQLGRPRGPSWWFACSSWSRPWRLVFGLLDPARQAAPFGPLWLKVARYFSGFGRLDLWLRMQTSSRHVDLAAIARASSYIKVRCSDSARNWFKAAIKPVISALGSACTGCLQISLSYCRSWTWEKGGATQEWDHVARSIM